MCSYYFPYVKGSMQNVDLDEDGVKETLTFKFENRIGSGAAVVTLTVKVDDVDYTDKCSIKVAEFEPRPVKPNMTIASSYGDVITIMVNHGGAIKPGKHRVSLKATVNWETYEFTVEEEVK